MIILQLATVCVVLLRFTVVKSNQAGMINATSVLAEVQENSVLLNSDGPNYFFGLGWTKHYISRDLV